MARMKTVTAPREERDVLVVAVDPLRVARGHRPMRRGGLHATAKKPTRAQAKQRWRREEG
jgi:hypothetical protein